MNNGLNPPLVLAGRWRRLMATCIDAALVPALSLVLVMLTDVVEDAEDFADNWWVLHVFLLAVASYLVLNGIGLWRRGQTIGKQLTGIMIVPATSLAAPPAGLAPAPLWKLIGIRALFFPMLFVVFVPWLTLLPVIDQLLIFRNNRRCLHDLLAGTIVINRPALP